MGIMTIGDKDGGVLTELRPPLGAIPTFDVGSGDGTSRRYWQEQIHFTGSGDQTIHSVDAGKRFHIQTIVLEVHQAGVSIRLKSGASQNISGIMRLAAVTPLVVPLTKDNPLQGKSNDDNFVISASGDYLTPHVSGFVTGYDEAT